MLKDITILDDLDLDKPVYRYMSVEKFLYLIFEKRLWFTRCDKLGDQHEGSLPEKLVKYRNDRLDKQILSDPTQVKEIQEVKKIYERGSYASRLQKFASCWTKNVPESLLMWKLYTPQSTGIAVESTVSRIGNSFVREPYDYFERYGMTIANTIYEDFSDIDRLDRDQIFYKRSAYFYEKEIKAFVEFRSTVETQDNLSISIDLDILISRIHVYSSSDSRVLKKSVEDLISTRDLKKEVLVPRFDIDVFW
jgi:hypothetical protein